MSDHPEMSFDGAETIIRLTNGSTLRAPAHPDPCAYVRVVGADGEEIAYWDANEWEEDPETVMGALVGAMKHSKRGEAAGLFSDDFLPRLE